MSHKKKLFDEDSDDEVTLKTENEYAKRYDQWREKEELHKLEQKYGSKALSSDASISSDSEDDDDEPLEVSEETEAQFLKTLALLKTKDPRIYDPNFKVFDEKKEKEEEDKPKAKTITFEDSDDDDDDGNIFTIEKKAEINVQKDEKATESPSKGGKKEGKLKEYLTGKVEHIDNEVEKDLAPLKALWCAPALNEGEAFLRDYILNKRYLEDGDVGPAEDRLRDDEDLEEDEKRVEEQGQFERAYNFRFEEPDQEFLKRYPRTMNYIRPKDDSRARKRAEVRARKEQEKQRKMDDIARLRALKLKEIQEKIARIKEVTGNEELAFREEDIEGDFDPAEHDRRMRALFDDQYYDHADDQKPVFPDLDEELEIENWEKYQPEQEREQDVAPEQDEDGPHCEDEDFNMDAEYDPKKARLDLMEELKSTMNKKRRNRKKKSKLAALLATEKPKYVPVEDKTYQQYMEEYYSMDCEDVIAGELPTRFKYRQVVPNDYGLSVEEILLADDKELTQWVPLKRIVKHRNPDVEKSEVNTYRLKAADVGLKRKVLPSLFKDVPEEPEVIVPLEQTIKKKKKKKKNKKNKTENVEKSETTTKNLEDSENTVPGDATLENDESQVEIDTQASKKMKKRKHKELDISNNTEEVNDTSPQKKKKKHKELDISNNTEEVNNTSPKKKKKQSNDGTNNETNTEDNKQEVRIETKLKKPDKESRKDIEEMSYEDGNKEVKRKEELLDAVGNKEGKRKKKKHKSDGFIVEDVKKEEPSSAGRSIEEASLSNKEKKKDRNQFQSQNNRKRNIDSNMNNQVTRKKKTLFNSGNANKKDFNNKKKKLKQKDNISSKQNEKSSDDPLSKLSDERLKAYGLNPKKYRSFLKYKKF